MRDIKFRGKLINSKEWTEGNLQVTKQGTTIITPDETVLGRYGKVIPETVGQYTGLKDKNGKEIYEGDIVFIKGETELLDIKGKVEYSNTFAQFIITNTGSIVNETEPLGDYEVEDIEVIGNIYDNKNLLEKGE